MSKDKDLKITIDRGSPLPFYVQVRRRLMSIIANWPDTSKTFYTDDELCRMFDVSRATVRQAMTELTQSGFLRRAKGTGTFVLAEKVEETFTPRMDFIDQWAAHGRPLRMDVKTFEERPCPDQIAKLLGLNPDDKVLYIERIRYAGPVPVSIDYRYLHPDSAKGILRDEVMEISLLDLLRRRVSLSVADIRVQASLVEEDLADILELLPGDPVLIRYFVYYDENRFGHMTGHSVYRADQVVYSLQVNVRNEAIQAHSSDRRDHGHDLGLGFARELGQNKSL